MTLPILVAIPHGEILFPEEGKENLALSEKRVQELYWDYGSNEIFDHASFSVLKAHYSRLFCDLNRAETDWSHSPDLKRAGVVRQQTEDGKSVYKTPLTEAEKKQRVQEHRRFYEACAEIIQKNHIRFFIAGHTMEDFPLKEMPSEKNERPDITLSTNTFQTCDKRTTLILKEAFEAQGFSVAIDDPFLGGYLLKHFCAAEKLPGVQIEVRRGLFAQDAHTINTQQLQNVSEKVERALLVFWEKFLAKSKG